MVFAPLGFQFKPHSSGANELPLGNRICIRLIFLTYMYVVETFSSSFFWLLAVCLGIVGDVSGVSVVLNSERRWLTLIF